MKYDVIVVGAGISGLICQKINQTGFSVYSLKNNYIGGKVNSKIIKDLQLIKDFM